MIKDKLSYILEKNKSKNKMFIANLLKEGIQDYILNFVYNHKRYKKLIFTGGTCLRKVYGLPRLSEDLDFNFLEKFNIEKFSEEIKRYFISELQDKDIKSKIANNKRTLFLKFPSLLTELNLVKNRADRQVLFVRCDFSKERLGIFKTEVNPISTLDFTFFVLSYDLATLFANKIIAFLQRKFFREKKTNISFKGRDLFDVVWFFQQRKKSGFELQPNWKRLFKGLKLRDKKELVDLLTEKAERINKKEVYASLLPFVESAETAEAFSENFSQIIKRGAEELIVSG